MAVAVKAAACALVLLLAGCQRADADYEACTIEADQALRDGRVEKPESQEVNRCMARKGWRQLRPHLPPGSNAWARTAP